jgi:hypothetical protein
MLPSTSAIERVPIFWICSSSIELAEIAESSRSRPLATPVVKACFCGLAPAESLSWAARVSVPLEASIHCNPICLDCFWACNVSMRVKALKLAC